MGHAGTDCGGTDCDVCQTLVRQTAARVLVGGWRGVTGTSNNHSFLHLQLGDRATAAAVFGLYVCSETSDRPLSRDGAKSVTTGPLRTSC